jgi:hypothetical protein
VGEWPTWAPLLHHGRVWVPSAGVVGQRSSSYFCSWLACSAAPQDVCRFFLVLEYSFLGVNMHSVTITKLLAVRQRTSVLIGFGLLQPIEHPPLASLAALSLRPISGFRVRAKLRAGGLAWVPYDPRNQALGVPGGLRSRPRPYFLLLTLARGRPASEPHASPLLSGCAEC